MSKGSMPEICAAVGDDRLYLRFGDILIRPIPGNPDKVFMTHQIHGDGGEFQAQDLVDLVADYFERMF